MSGYGPFDGLAQVAAALATILLALVSLAGSAQRRDAVALAQARVQDLCELTGITDPRQLQDVFGPPDMGRVWRHVTMDDIARARRPLGHLISDDRVDWACIGVAALSFFLGGDLMSLLLLGALGAQLAGWVLVMRLPR